ncbi:hypothetical protein AYI68_g6414 [Smittium mucronatum]|uniref:Uncharacterized protein n=1 Tax=Smittium mucronatum TaxID=133383 RepID=A0A1R0GRI6_9FUNG|nr:hypothetical protein AYI68_g6414 [Smittium mucronatum]
MITDRPNIQSDHGSVRDTLCRHVCLMLQKEKDLGIVPRPYSALYRTNTPSSGKEGSSRSRKRKISTLQQQVLISIGLEDQWYIFKVQDLTDIVIEVIR